MNRLPKVPNVRNRALSCPPLWREQSETTRQKLRKMVKNVNILEFGDDFQNDHEKYMESTNRLSIDLERHEIGRKMSAFLRKSKRFCMAKLRTC